jgi:hypothetical protein
MNPKPDKETFLEEEIIIVRNSGEIPEVALHGSLYYLTEDPEGPRLSLTEQEVVILKGKVIERYQEIIMRDLNPDCRDLSMYRGLKRCMANWRRLKIFCRREGRDLNQIREETGAALLNFLAREIEDVRSGARTTSLNCRLAELADFARQLSISLKDLPEGWQKLKGQE